MTTTAETVWSNCLKIIKDIVEWQHFKTWFEPIKAVELKGNVLLIQVPSQFFYEYLEEHYVNLLAKTLRSAILGKGSASWNIRIMVDSGNHSNAAADDGCACELTDIKHLYKQRNGLSA